MHPADNRAFVNQLLVPALVLICLGGSVGMGAVWAQHQISLKANNTKQLEQQIKETERHLAELGTLITAEQSIEVLTRRNTEWRLGLVPPKEPQVVRVSEPAGPELAGWPATGPLADARPVVAVRFPLEGRRR